MGEPAVASTQQQQQALPQRKASDTSKANEEALLHKAKLKEAAKALQTNFFFLLPPEGMAYRLSPPATQPMQKH